MIHCIFCNKLFTPRQYQVICGPECDKFKDDKYKYVEPNQKYYTARRRAKMRRGDRVIPLVVFEMFNWTCILCGGQINKDLRLPHIFAATVEHLIPLSKNGTHTWMNCYPAHDACNSLKSNN